MCVVGGGVVVVGEEGDFVGMVGGCFEEGDICVGVGCYVDVWGFFGGVGFDCCFVLV